MKYVKEIVIIFGITMVGELLNMFIPLPVPAGVYGLFILLGGLCTKVISLSDVEVTGNLLLDLMPVMFIPAAVGIIDKIEELKAIMIPMLIITFVTSGYLAVVGVVCGHNWPAFLGFRGGKGVATSLGSMIAINPVLALSCFGIFLVIVAITKYVSLGAIVGISMSPIMMIFTKNSKGLIATLFLTVSVIYTHRENIKRLLSGTERKLGEKK